MDKHEWDGGTHARCQLKKVEKIHKYYEQWQVLDLTSDQMHGHSSSNVARKSLSELVLKSF